MLIKTQLSEKDYINATFATIIARKALLVIIGVFFLVSLTGGIASIALGQPDLSKFAAPVVMVLVLPAMFYFSAKRAYGNNKRAGEAIEYWFEPEMLKMKGESFSAEQTWGKILKVTLTKNWLLIWQSKQIANAIPRRDVWDGEIQELKRILAKHAIKNNLP